MKPVVSAALLWLLATAAAPAAPPGEQPSRVYGKPRAPVSVEWLAPPAPGRVVARIRPEADYERLELLLIGAGGGEPDRRAFGPGGPDEPLMVEWSLAPGDDPPRLLLLMQIDGQLLKRTSAPPRIQGSDRARAQEDSAGRVDSEAGLRVLPATREPER